VGGHEIELRHDVVIKRYGSTGHDQPEREWRALELLHAYAPGLAPAPVSVEPDADPPTVVMSRLAGAAVRGPIVGYVADALAGAVTRVQHAIPRPVLERVPARAGHPVELLRHVRAWSATVPPHGDPAVADALGQAASWVVQPRLEELLAQPGTPVFGTGDGNLANYLWDGTDVRVIDFEYSGRSDRAFELAEVVEHISACTRRPRRRWASHPARRPPIPRASRCTATATINISPGRLGPPDDLRALWAGRKECDDRFQAWASPFIKSHGY
jgi:aminoglycoside phosphotransferase (APT) family kinase protein